MATTSASLLDRLKAAPSDSPEWQRLHDLYAPLIQFWLARVLGVRDEADDLAQEVLIVVVREIPAFDRRRNGSFRAWLRQIAVNQARAFFKKRRRRWLPGSAGELEQALAQLEDPKSELSLQWEREHDRHVTDKLLQLVRKDFAPETWEAFSRFALEGKPAAQVAQELAISENSVLLAKSRILKRLRHEAGDIMS